MSDQRSIGINVLTSDKTLAQFAYERFAMTAKDMGPQAYDHVSVYTTALDEDVEIEDVIPEGVETEMTMHKVRDALKQAFDDTDVEHVIGLLHNAGIFFREKD